MIKNNRLIPQGYFQVDNDQKIIPQSNATIAYKVMKQLQKDSSIYHLELYPNKNYQLIKQYYSQWINLTKLQKSKLNFLQVHEVGLLVIEDKNKTNPNPIKKNFIYIIRQYVSHRKNLYVQLANNPLKNQTNNQSKQVSSQIKIDGNTRLQYILQLINTINLLFNQRNLYFGQISPYNIITCRQRQLGLKQDLDSLKIVDTYINYVTSNNYEKQQISPEAHNYYLHPQLLQKRQKLIKPKLSHDLWGLGITLRFIASSQNMSFDKLKNPNKQEIRIKVRQFYNLNQQQKKKKLLGQQHKEDKKEEKSTSDNIIESSIQLMQIAKLEQTTTIQTIIDNIIIKLNKIDDDNVIKDQEQIQLIKKAKQQKQLKSQLQTNIQKFQNIQIEDQNAFKNIKQLQQKKSQQQKKKLINEWAERVTNTIYGNRVIFNPQNNYKQQKKKGKIIANGRVQYLKPDRTTQSYQLVNEQIVICDVTIQNKSGKQKKLKLIYKADGFNPIKISGSTFNAFDADITYSYVDEKGERIGKQQKTKEIDTFSYNNRILQDMRNKLKGIELKKQLRQKFIKNVEKFTKEYGKKQIINMRSSIQQHSWVPFITSDLQFVTHLNISKNNLLYSDFQIIRQYNIIGFRKIKQLRLSQNKIDDNSLNLLCEASKKKKNQFQFLQTLKLDHNFISNCTQAFSKEDNNNFQKLYHLDLQDNTIQSVSQNTFSSLKNIKVIFLRNNPICKNQLSEDTPRLFYQSKEWYRKIIWT